MASLFTLTLGLLGAAFSSGWLSAVPSPPQLQLAVGLAVLTALLRASVGVWRPDVWRKSLALSLACAWVGQTMWGCGQMLASLATIQVANLEPLVAHALPTSLAVGVLLRMASADSPELRAAMSAVGQGALTLLVWAHPQSQELGPLLLLAALGFCPGRVSVSKTDLKAATASLLEMTSLQTVAWTVLLTLLNPAMEFSASRYLDALFTFLSTPVLGGIGSGLLWGASVNLRPKQ